MAMRDHHHDTMHGMPPDSLPESSPYRVTLFFGPDHVTSTASTYACVFNVKKRSWKGGIQVAVEITESQIESSRAITGFGQWLADALVAVPPEDRQLQGERAGELFVQAVCWCKLDLALQTGIVQENQCLAAGAPTGNILQETVRGRRDFITSYVMAELDLTPRSTPP